MGKNSIFREFFRYVGLNVLGMIGLSCYILADTYFVSKALGTSGLAALNLAISVYSVINATGLMMGAGGGTRFSIFMFQGHENEARRVYTRTVGLALAAGGVFLLAGLFCVPAIAALLGADADTMDKTTAYLRVILCFAPCFIMNNTLLAFVRNDGNPRLSMTAMLTGSQDLVPIARRGIQLYFAGFLFAGVNIVSAAFLSAVVETGKAFCISIVRGCLAIIPLAFLLPGIWGMDGVWLSFVLAEAAACVVSAAGIMRAGTP